MYYQCLYCADPYQHHKISLEIPRGVGAVEALESHQTFPPQKGGVE